jgi:hypothetical protein
MTTSARSTSPNSSKSGRSSYDGRQERGKKGGAKSARGEKRGEKKKGVFQRFVLIFPNQQKSKKTKKKLPYLPGVRPGEALDDHLQPRRRLRALLARRARRARPRGRPLAPGRALPSFSLGAALAASGAHVAVLAVLTDQELAPGEVGPVERRDGHGGLVDVLELDDAPALGAALNLSWFFVVVVVGVWEGG